MLVLVSYSMQWLVHRGEIKFSTARQNLSFHVFIQILFYSVCHNTDNNNKNNNYNVSLLEFYQNFKTYFKINNICELTHD